jgi:hypothetical protein
MIAITTWSVTGGADVTLAMSSSSTAPGMVTMALLRREAPVRERRVVRVYEDGETHSQWVTLRGEQTVVGVAAGDELWPEDFVRSLGYCLPFLLDSDWEEWAA